MPITLDGTAGITTPAVTSTGTTSIANVNLSSTTTAPATGIYLPSSGTLGFSTGSTQRTTINSSGVLSHSGNVAIDTNVLFVDGVSNRVGIGTTTPETVFSISSGQASFPAGSVSAPSITTTGDTNTGVFFPAADTAAISTGGSERMRVDSSGNVGIGTSSPISNFHVSSTRTSVSWGTHSTPMQLVASVVVGDIGTAGGSFAVRTGSINSNFSSGLGVDGYYSGGPDFTSTVNLKAFGPQTNGYFGDMAFSTTFNDGIRERMRIRGNSNNDSQIYLGNGKTHSGVVTNAIINGTDAVTTANTFGSNISIVGGACTGSAEGGMIKFFTGLNYGNTAATTWTAQNAVYEVMRVRNFSVIINGGGLRKKVDESTAITEDGNRKTYAAGLMVSPRAKDYFDIDLNGGGYTTGGGQANGGYGWTYSKHPGYGADGVPPGMFADGSPGDLNTSGTSVGLVCRGGSAGTYSSAAAGLYCEAGNAFVRGGQAPASAVFRSWDNPTIIVDRFSTDGTIIDIRQGNTTEGTISVSGTTVSYNAFMGSHWATLSDWSRPDIKVGTILESIGSLVEYKVAVFDVPLRTPIRDSENDEINGVENALDENGNQIFSKMKICYNGNEPTGSIVSIDFHDNTYSAVLELEKDKEFTKGVQVKISDTVGSKAVYGVFHQWNNDKLYDGGIWNDMHVAGLGNYVIRMAADQNPQIGDLIESNGDGCGKVQDNDNVTSKTVAKITSNLKQVTYEDGSFLVSCVLYCG